MTTPPVFDATVMAAVLTSVLPLLAFGVIMVFTRSRGHLSAMISIGAVSGSLACALSTAEASDMPALVGCILRRGDPQACLVLIERYERLPMACQATVRAALPAMSGLLRRAMHSQKAELRRTVMHMIVDGRLWRLCYLLAELTLDGATRFRADAASA